MPPLSKTKIGLYITDNDISVTRFDLATDNYVIQKMCCKTNEMHLLKEHLRKTKNKINYQGEPVISCIFPQHEITKEFSINKTLSKKEIYYFLKRKAQKILNAEELQLDYTISRLHSSYTKQPLKITATSKQHTVFLANILNETGFKLVAIDSPQLATARALTFLRKQPARKAARNTIELNQLISLGLALWRKNDGN